MHQYIQVSYYEDPQQRPAPCACGLCGGELYGGDVYYDMGGRIVCRECLEYFARRYFLPCRKRVEAVR